jgi:hypothetical protein
MQGNIILQPENHLLFYFSAGLYFIEKIIIRRFNSSENVLDIIIIQSLLSMP